MQQIKEQESLKPPCSDGNYVCMSTEAFQKMLDEAGKNGARAALAELGLKPDEADSAAVDMRDIRAFFSAWRQAKRELLKRILSSIINFFTFLLFLGMVLIAAKTPEQINNWMPK